MFCKHLLFFRLVMIFEKLLRGLYIRAQLRLNMSTLAPYKYKLACSPMPWEKRELTSDVCLFKERNKPELLKAEAPQSRKQLAAKGLLCMTVTLETGAFCF